MTFEAHSTAFASDDVEISAEPFRPVSAYCSVSEPEAG